MKIVDDNNQNPKPNPTPGGIPTEMLAQAEYAKCEECEGTLFEEQLMIKKISKFMTGSDRDSIVPVPVLACSKCGHVNEMFKPQL
jgi:uncharacterized Zn finger protein